MSAERRDGTGTVGSAFAVVTGGGTSGHVLPALAIADALVANGHRRDEIVYIGARRGIETRLVPPTGYPHHFLDVVGLQRRITLSNLTFPVKLVRAIAHARSLMKRLRPAVVVSVGGYASFPATFAARLRRIPVVVVSYDRIPGLASRISARFATVSAVAFEGSRLPRARHTGAPVRRDLVLLDRTADRDLARRALALPLDRFVIAVFGGSLGSKLLNDAVTAMVEQLSDRPDIAVRHVVGDRFLDGAAPERTGENGIMYDVIGYEDQMVRVYAAADLMVTRAGASTIAELATAGMPAVIVPWAASADDHQSDNARILGDIGAAVLLTEADVARGGLTAAVLQFVDDPAHLAEVGARAHAAGDIHRSGRLTALIEQIGAGR
jgi:UDP-N-acetylglucosamine--N-acetylmuramyl-(pentapeptide) pyrophosphoryl-undecaprenol N-acetylglucosamine transferase